MAQLNLTNNATTNIVIDGPNPDSIIDIVKLDYKIVRGSSIEFGSTTLYVRTASDVDEVTVINEPLGVSDFCGVKFTGQGSNAGKRLTVGVILNKGFGDAVMSYGKTVTCYNDL